MLQRHSFIFQEADELTESMVKWDARFTPLQPESSPHKLDIVSSDSAFIQQFYIGQRMNLQTASPKGRITFGLPSETSEMVYVDNEKINQSIVLFPGGIEHDSVTPAGYSPTAISIEKNHLASLAESFELNLDIETLDVSKIVNLISPVKRREIRQFVDNVLKQKNARDSEQQKMLEQDLPLLILSIVTANKQLNKTDTLGDYLSLARAKQFINGNALSPINISDICKASFIQERTLERVFKKYISLTPSEYLRAVRLNAARKALKSINNTLKVSEISIGCGFMHAGRFSNYYREQYGETPSQTIMKKRQQK